MENLENKHRATDYTHQLRPRRHSMDGLSSAASRPLLGHTPAPISHHSKPVARPKSDEEYRVSISINLPDYNQWRITKFGHQYPYLSLGLAVLGLLVLALFTEGLVTLWHHITQQPVKTALIFTERFT